MRIQPIPVAEWSPQMWDALAAMTPPTPRHARPIQDGRPKALNTLGTFAHHPELARAFLGFNGHLLRATTLSQRHRELLVLRVATVRECDYEWAQHVFIARDVGLTDAEIARVGIGPDAPLWNDLEASLLRAVDELIADGEIAATTWTLLSAALEVEQLLDLIFTVGAYETLAWMMRSFDLDLDDDIREMMASLGSRSCSE